MLNTLKQVKHTREHSVCLGNYMIVKEKYGSYGSHRNYGNLWKLMEIMEANGSEWMLVQLDG